MIAIKDMEIPKSCAECKFCIRQKTNDYGSYGQCVAANCETVNTLILSPGCPVTEIITCEECEHWDMIERYCRKTCCDTEKDFYCGDGERRE